MKNAGTSRGISVLVVEDEKEARDLLVSMIGMDFPHATLLPAENGLIGLELYKKYEPDIVITDIYMPVMDGIKMSEAIKALNPNADIIYLTAFSDQLFLERLNSTGFHNIYGKAGPYGHIVQLIDEVPRRYRKKKRRRHLINGSCYVHSAIPL